MKKPIYVRQSLYNRAGLSLIELIVSMAAASLIIAGLPASLYIASQSLDRASSVQRTEADKILDKFVADIEHALTFTERTATAVTFTVPDRDNDGAPETIRYAWSGAPNYLLTYRYNDLSEVTLADNVQNFNLTSTSRQTATEDLIVTPPPSGTGLLLVVDDITTLTAQETARKSLAESWGYAVTPMAASDSQANFDAAVTINSVAYISEEINSADLGTKLKNVPIGVVNGEVQLADEFGFASDSDYPAASNLMITDNSHYITSEFSTGSLHISSASQNMASVLGTLAAGLHTLGDYGGSATLATLSPGASLYGGGTAAGRRVLLPWGDSSFDITLLTSDGQTLLQRSLEWAAGAGDDTSPSGIVFEEFTEKHESSSVNNITIDLPPGTSAGDLLIAAVAYDGEKKFNEPSGWTQISEDDENKKVAFSVWYRIAGSSEPATHNFSWDGNQEAYGWIMRFTGHDPSDPINDSNSSKGKSATPESPSVGTGVDNCMVLRLGAFDHGDITIDDAGIAGHTTITMDESSSGNGASSGGAAYSYQESAGSSSNENFTITASEEFVTITIAIAPDSIQVMIP